MNVDEVISALQNQIQMLEDTKTLLTELQEETRQVICQANALFDTYGHLMKEVDPDGNDCNE